MNRPLVNKFELLPDEQQAYAYIRAAIENGFQVCRYKQVYLTGQPVSEYLRKFVVTGKSMRHANIVYLYVYFETQRRTIKLTKKGNIFQSTAIPEYCTEEIKNPIAFLNKLTMPEELCLTSY